MQSKGTHHSSSNGKHNDQHNGHMNGHANGHTNGHAGDSYTGDVSANSGSGRGESSTPRRVLVLGLDGATFDLIRPWVAAGHLPTLARLMAEGAQGEIRSTVPPMTGPAWTTFATGVNPAKHGVYDWIARDAGTYHFSPLTALDCKAPTLYRLLSAAGRRVCALNVPMTYPPTPVNGVMVSGMPAPSNKVEFTYPSSLREEIMEAVGDYIVYPDPGQAYSDSGVDAFLERLYRTTDLRLKTLDYLMQREAWDFAMVVFNGTDTICHALWKYMDESHPLHNPRKAEKYGDAILAYYKYLDAHLAPYVDELPEDTTLVIMSDHGFGPFHKFIHVNNWLLEQGFMKLKSGAGTRLKQLLFRNGFTPMNIYDLLMRMGLGALKRQVVRGQGQGLLKRLFLSFDDIDWARTQAYSLGNVGQIHLNVAGREPQGCVQPGLEYETVRDRLMAHLQEMRDPATGETVAEHLYRREELYHGPQFSQAPDIVFLPRRLEYFGFGEYEFGSHRIIESMRRGISGTHRMNGIFLAYGSAVRPGASVEDGRLEDLAPTILRLMGEPVAGHMDGRVLDEALIAERLPAVAVAQAAFAGNGRGNGDSGENGGTASPAGLGNEIATPVGMDAELMLNASAEEGLSDEDRDLLAERLRSLGYVG